MVTSAPMKTQFIKSEDAARGAVYLGWLFGVIVPFLASAFGNYVTFVGGWSALGNGLVWKNIGFAFAWQLTCGVAQFMFKAKADSDGGFGWWIAYIVALLISVVPSFIGYYTPVVDYVQPYLAGRIPAQGIVPLVALFVLIGTAILDMLPEWVAME